MQTPAVRGRISITPLILLRRATRGALRHPLGRLGVVLLICGLGRWAWWYNEHRAMSWSETFNPMYWFRRWRGDDLYLENQAFLKHGNRRLPEVALTFDDGPHPDSLPSILDTLRRYQVHATFFDVGTNMTRWPELVRQTLAQGCEVGNHSSTHQRLGGLSPLERHHEINDADITYFRITGQHLDLLRPPGMAISAAVLRDAKSLGYIVVGYTTASRDFIKDETPDYITQRTLDRTEAGSIILLHDYPSTASALPALLAALKARGLRPVTVSQMLADLPQDPLAAVDAFRRASGDRPLPKAD